MEVMAVQERLIGAAREAAMTVADQQSPTNRRRNGTRAAAHVEDTAGRVARDDDQTAIAGHPPKRLLGNVRSISELRAERAGGRRQVGSHVQHNFAARAVRGLGRGALGGAREERGGDMYEPFGAGGAGRRALDVPSTRDDRC
jgi:hypothetical protein